MSCSVMVCGLVLMFVVYLVLWMCFFSLGIVLHIVCVLRVVVFLFLRVSFGILRASCCSSICKILYSLLMWLMQEVTIWMRRIRGLAASLPYMFCPMILRLMFYDLCAFVLMLAVYVLYISLGSSVTPILIFFWGGGGWVFMGSVVLSLCRCSLVLFC